MLYDKIAIFNIYLNSSSICIVKRDNKSINCCLVIPSGIILGIAAIHVLNKSILGLRSLKIDKRKKNNQFI